MATNKKITPIDSLGINMKDPYEVYSWNTKLDGTSEKTKKYALDDLAMNNYIARKNAQGVNNFSLPSVIHVLMPAITEYFPNPLSFENKSDALALYRDLCINAINHYNTKINSMRSQSEKKKLPVIDKIDFDILVEIIFGYYDVINFATSKTDRITGVLMGMTKDETEVNATLVQLQNVIYDFMPMLATEKNTKENMKKLDARLKSDARTTLHITDMQLEREHDEFWPDAIPMKNGVYIKELYDQMGRLLTYREAAKEYGLFFKTNFAAEYLGPNNPAPVMSDGITPEIFLKEFYASTPERWRQMMSVVLAILRINDDSYNKAMFLMDDGLGNTGKSTFIKWLRYMLGLENCAKLSLEQIANTAGYSLSLLRDQRKCFIYADENEPNDFYEKMVNFKELVTGDPITISAKYENDITINFHGRMVQSINNGMIKSSDYSPSVYKRFLTLKCMHKVDPGDGSSIFIENKEIKKSYVMRQDWINWLATEAINANERNLIETDETKAIKSSMEEYNNKVLKFFNKYVNNMQQNWFRLDWLFVAFQVFMEDDNNTSKTSFDTFTAEAKKIIARHDSQWTYTPESILKPEEPKQKNVNGMTVPLDKMDSLKYDPIYTTLVKCTKPGNMRFEKYRETAETALSKMYHTEKPGTIRGVYYRKKDAETNVLLDLAGCLVATYDTKDNFTVDEIYPLLVEDKWFNRPYLEDTDDFSDGKREVTKSKLEPTERKLREHILARLSKLNYKKGA